MLGIGVKIISTYFLLSVPIFLALSRLNASNKTGKTELLIYSFGLGPPLVTLLLHYLLFLTPGLNNWYYFGFIWVIFGSMTLWGKNYFYDYLKAWKPLLQLMRSGFRFSLRPKKILRIFKKEGFAQWMAQGKPLALLGLLFLIKWIGVTLFEPISGHDMLEYTIQARIFFEEKLIQYEFHRFDEASSFYYVGLHGFAFPLIGTWEQFWNEIFGFQGEHLLKSVTGFYAGLILALGYYWLNKVSSQLATFGIYFIYFTFGFYLTSIVFHIDTFRIFLFLAMAVFTLKLIQYNDRFSLVVSGVFGGCASMAHSIGMMLTCFALLTAFVFLEGNWTSTKLKKTVVFGLLVLAFGGFHYVLDSLIGTGWVFREIKFY